MRARRLRNQDYYEMLVREDRGPAAVPETENHHLARPPPRRLPGPPAAAAPPPGGELPALSRPVSGADDLDVNNPKSRQLAKILGPPPTDRWSDVMHHVHKLELRVAVQDRTVVELREEVAALRRLRELDARELEPAHAAVMSVASRQATDEGRLGEVWGLVRSQALRLEALERSAAATVEGGARRLEALEGQLAPSIARLSAANAANRDESIELAATEYRHDREIEALRAELRAVGVRAEAGERAAKGLRDVVDRQSEELRLVISGEAFEASRAVSDEAAARAGLGLMIERRTAAMASALERRSDAKVTSVELNVDDLRARLSREQRARETAVGEALGMLAHKWTAMGQLRDHDQEARRQEADALRKMLGLAVRDALRRFDDFRGEAAKREAALEARVGDGLARQQAAADRFQGTWIAKAEEMERVLSAEISARRRHDARLAAKQQSLEDAARADLVNATNRLGRFIRAVDERMARGLRACGDRYDVVALEASERARRLGEATERRFASVFEACEATAAACRAVHASAEAKRAAFERRVVDDRLAGFEALCEARFGAAAREVADLAHRLEAGLATAAARGKALEAFATEEGTEARRVAREDLVAEAAAVRAEVHRSTADLDGRVRAQHVAVERRLDAAEERRDAALRAGLAAASEAQEAAFAGLVDRLAASEAAVKEDVQGRALELAEAMGKLKATTKQKLHDVRTDEAAKRARDLAALEAGLTATFRAADSAHRAEAAADFDELRHEVNAENADVRAAVANEGRAARAAARAFVEAEAAERRDRLEALEARLGGLASQAEAKAEAICRAVDLRSAGRTAKLAASEANAHDRLEAGVRRELDEKAADSTTRTAVAEALRFAVDSVADADALGARRRLAAEVDAVDRRARKRTVDLASLLMEERQQRKASDAREREARVEAVDAVDRRAEARVEAVVEAVDAVDRRAEARAALQTLVGVVAEDEAIQDLERLQTQVLESRGALEASISATDAASQSRDDALEAHLATKFTAAYAALAEQTEKQLVEGDARRAAVAALSAMTHLEAAAREFDVALVSNSCDDLASDLKSGLREVTDSLATVQDSGVGARVEALERGATDAVASAAAAKQTADEARAAVDALAEDLAKKLGLTRSQIDALRQATVATAADLDSLKNSHDEDRALEPKPSTESLPRPAPAPAAPAPPKKKPAREPAPPVRAPAGFDNFA